LHGIELCSALSFLTDFPQDIAFVPFTSCERLGYKKKTASSGCSSIGLCYLQSKRKLSEESHVGDPYAARECSFVRSSEVAQFVRDKGVCRVQLSVADIESILSVAVLDRSIERRADGMYRALGADTMRSASALLPCLQCPLAADCFPGAEIAPQTCEYFAQWLANS
uniref:DNA-directed RNA polymerase III subunit RPC6 n=1 Tax=Toxocara canis TaxID=6265 RepID=A0A183U649_TOXCA